MTHFTTILVGKTYTFFTAEYGSRQSAYNHALRFRDNWNCTQDSIAVITDDNGCVIGYSVKV